jgi:hypothetical protein
MDASDMFDGVEGRVRAVLRRLRRLERREFQALRTWVETTSNLVHVSVLLFVPALIAVVTYVSQVSAAVSFLLFPPLASGTYTLFANPESKYASPVRFVAGLTAGAVCGLLAVRLPAVVGFDAGDPVTTAASAAFAVFAVGALTWVADVEEPSAFSAALLTLLAAYDEVVVYVVGVAVSASFVAVAFVAWRDLFYERRGEYLYQTTTGDDHVLVPVVGDRGAEAAFFGARIAAAHEAGKVVLLDLVEAAEVAAAAESIADTDDRSDDAGHAMAESEAQVAGQSAMRLERLASRLRTRVGVPCEVVVASVEGSRADATLAAARDTNCDLVVAPYESRHGSLSPFVKSLFDSSRDVVVFRGGDGEVDASWRRVLVAVGRPGENTNAMLDFATRVAGRAGELAVCHCIDGERERRAAEAMLADLVEPFDARFETRVSTRRIERFLAANESQYDLIVVGASTDRSAASRFLSPPTFQRLSDLEADVAIVHRGRL